MENQIKKIQAAVATALKGQKRWEASFSSGGSQIILTLSHLDPEKRMTKFYEGMAAMAASGFMKGYNPARIAQMRASGNKLRPEKYDYQVNLDIIECTDKKTAGQMLKNQADIFTKGFNMQAPGMPDGVSFFDAIKKAKGKIGLSPAQVKQIEEASEKMEKEFSKVKNKTGLKYSFGKFQGFDAVFQQMAKTPKVCRAITIGNYLLAGDLFSLGSMLPPGSKPTFTIGKQPGMGEGPKSTVAQEGYAYKEEVEEMAEKVIKAVAKLAK